ncbi:hypothetical protein [Rhodopseudomonas faecalis]|uniref:hypothetical protein n=1 Tax=Rhodopseudomonas faecalis TaxID=99655 RepID=UPI0015E8D591|nr:hypothetical protein [Rhodopseudomonas faecalis]
MILSRGRASHGTPVLADTLRPAALTYAERLAQLAPLNARLVNLIRELKRQ